MIIIIIMEWSILNSLLESIENSCWSSRFICRICKAIHNQLNFFTLSLSSLHLFFMKFIYFLFLFVCLFLYFFVFFIHFFQLSENHTEVQWLWMPQWRRGVLCMRVSDKIELTTTTNASVRAHTHTPDTHRPERASA